MRRTAGDGTVVKRVKGGVTYYVARVVLKDGTRKERWFRKRAEADLARKQMVAERDHTGVIPPERLTVAELVAEWFDLRSEDWKGSARRNHVGYFRRYIEVPDAKIGAMRIRDVTARDVERWMLWLSRTWKLAPRTIQSVRTTLNGAFTYAVQRELLSRNVVGFVKPPKVPRSEMIVLTPEQAAKLIEVAMQVKNGAALIMMVTTGIRGGEVLALRWSDLNWKTGELRIQRGAKLEFDGSKLTLDETKNRSSTRTIVLPAVALSALKEHQQAQREARVRAVRWDDLNLIFPNSFGAVGRHNRQLADPLKDALAKAEIAYLHPHGLRHTAISILLDDGQPVPDVSMLAGHSNPSITMSVYAHRLPGTGRRMASAMDRLMGGKTEDREAK